MINFGLFVSARVGNISPSSASCEILSEGRCSSAKTIGWQRPITRIQCGSLAIERALKIAGWEVLGTLLLAASYLALPARWRQVSTFKTLALNVAFAAICVTGLVTLVMNVNGYTASRLGIGLDHLGPASTTVGLVTVLGLGALAALARLGRQRLVLNANMIKLGLAYPAWAYVQQLLVMGVFINLVADWLGTWAGVVVGGLVFGAIHWGNRPFLFLTAAIGLLWARSFLSYPNLLPLAFSHAILATAHCYWVKGEDKWARIFAKPGRSRKETPVESKLSRA